MQGVAGFLQVLSRKLPAQEHQLFHEVHRPAGRVLAEFIVVVCLVQRRDVGDARIDRDIGADIRIVHIEPVDPAHCVGKP